MDVWAFLATSAGVFTVAGVMLVLGVVLLYLGCRKDRKGK